MNAPDSGIGTDPGPQVRTLLLTDLCDSTTLVERMGDNEAAELFRAHDRLVLKLQQQWHGRLIDRSDGLLLLFERPIDGLGFAMDYVRGLRDLGEQHKVARHGVELQARAGLHVGEVLTWRNSEAAVNVGAKPLEVEGLAKPMAGRLMTLARPGQILLSATAEPLAHRAARELGERGEHLLWKSHGRWRFKGVPQAQDIYEVGEPGIAPLRAPQQNRAKAWRDIPLWRRPAALAAELLLVAGLVGGAWFMARPQPAIAFAERDWVVVADLRNLTGDQLLDESLEQAFRISLEQSRYVNVLSDLKARDTLERMRRKPGTALDRAVASEIALRDGARAVILPTVAEIGGRVRVSAEVVDPHTQTTVYAASADGSGADSTLASIDRVTAELRGKLGEALQSIQKNSVPLPTATTGNLDALKAFAIAHEYRATGDREQAMAFLERAISLDPDFALAMLAAGGTKATLGDLAGARDYYARAAALRDRLPPRERMELDARMAERDAPRRSQQLWREMLALYPDAHEARFRLGQDLFFGGLYDESLEHARAAAAIQSPFRARARYLEGMALLGLGREREAIDAFDASAALDYRGAGISHAYAYASLRDYEGAKEVLDRLDPHFAEASLEDEIYALLVAIDQGRLDDARKAAAEGLRQAGEKGSEIAEAEWRSLGLATDIVAGQAGKEMQDRLMAELERLRAQSAGLDAIFPEISRHLLLGIGYLGARIDALAVVEAAIAAVDTAGIDDHPLQQQMLRVLAAEQARVRGDAKDAVEQLRPLVAAEGALVPAHSALARAAEAAGLAEVAAGERQWLAAHRSRAFVEEGIDNLTKPLNVVDTAMPVPGGAATP